MAEAHEAVAFQFTVGAEGNKLEPTQFILYVFIWVLYRDVEDIYPKQYSCVVGVLLYA